MSTPDYDKISRYVDGEMSALEIREFEQLIQQDAELRSEVELYKEVNETLKTRLHPGEGEMALRNTLNSLQYQYFQKDKKGLLRKVDSDQPAAKIVSFRRRRWLAVAAAAAIIILVMIWSPWSQPNLYRQYASIEMTSFAERGTPADSIKKEVTEKFNDKKFEETIPLFEKLLKLDSANSFFRFHYAVALLEIDQVEKSRAELAQLYNGTSIFRYDAAFYTALSYLKVKNKDACKEWLNKIPEDASVYSKSRRLLNQL